jgi:hypothetical protein
MHARNPISDDEKHKAEDALQDLLLEGVQSSGPEELTPPGLG